MRGNAFPSPSFLPGEDIKPEFHPSILRSHHVPSTFTDGIHPQNYQSRARRPRRFGIFSWWIKIGLKVKRNSCRVQSTYVRRATLGALVLTWPADAIRALMLQLPLMLHTLNATPNQPRK